MHVLVTGASGYIGAALVPRLQAAGHRVRGYGRSAARITAPVDEVVEGDAILGTGLDRALDGVEVAYFLIHSMEGPGNGFADLERQAAEQLRRRGRRRRRAADRLPRRARAGRRPDLAPPRLAARGRGAAAGRRAGVDRDARLDRDRRALALVPLPRAAGRADARARAARVARQPHRAGRRPRHARVPDPRRDRAAGALGPVVGHRGPGRDELRGARRADRRRHAGQPPPRRHRRRR